MIHTFFNERVDKQDLRKLKQLKYTCMEIIYKNVVNQIKVCFSFFKITLV